MRGSRLSQLTLGLLDGMIRTQLEVFINLRKRLVRDKPAVFRYGEGGSDLRGIGLYLLSVVRQETLEGPFSTAAADLGGLGAGNHQNLFG